MKRLLAVCLLAALLLLMGCGASEAVKPNTFRVTLTNQSEDVYHGFGVEWYEDGRLIQTETAMKKDFLFLKNGEEFTCELSFNEESLPTSRACAIRVYIIGTEHAVYCMEKPMPVEWDSGEICLDITGSEAEGWSAE